ncbi:MAG: M3 family metallopeptidase [Bdellovibrionaceae bacterium]|nr:M3 family metallopeptidase [Pseudobdellovibrionaceae bacterium]
MEGLICARPFPMENIGNNPLLKPFTNKDEAVPFDQIRLEHFVPAIEESIRRAKAKVEAIKKNPEPPTFFNTIVALEEAGHIVDRVSQIYGNLEHAHGDEQLRALAKEIYPKLSAWGSDVTLDSELFARVKSVYEQKDKLNLDKEDRRLLEKTWLSFRRNGALLDGAAKEKIRAIDQELSLLSSNFSENVLKATNAFELWITDKDDLAGLPESAIEAAAFAAEQKGKKGSWLFTLQYPSFGPFMMYSARRELREKMWRAYGSRAFRDNFDNQALILKRLRLKAERARLLGYKNHVDFTLEQRMAGDAETVLKFLRSLLGPSKAAAERELKELREFAAQDGIKELKPWDVSYYSEKLKEAKYSFNEEDLRPYFQLEKVVAGVFEHASKLYGLEFREEKSIPVYHPDVKAYEVFERNSGRYMGLFYTDFFPRETKQGGAWMTLYREQGSYSGEIKRPHVSIVCNFTKSTPTRPSLLTYDEVRTLFHEFGHALHGLLSDCRHTSLAGTNVYWDFVELPSQIMENWVTEKEGLDVFARHYQTNEPIPAELVEKIKASQKFMAGWASLRQLQFALLDMAWYLADPEKIKDVSEFEIEATKETRLFPPEPGVNNSCSFSHIFAGGYSAGYYSYKWAEVLDADAFEHFREKGIFNPEVAGKFREFILSKGDTEHPMELYKKFRGREPDPNALLRRDGLI